MNKEQQNRMSFIVAKIEVTCGFIELVYYKMEGAWFRNNHRYHFSTNIKGVPKFAVIGFVL